MCPRHLWDAADGLACDLPDGHGGAHVYHASDAPDRHTYTEPTEGVH